MRRRAELVVARADGRPGRTESTDAEDARLEAEGPFRRSTAATALAGAAQPLVRGGYRGPVDVRFCDEWAGGFSWIVDEPMTRTSHALVDGGRVWLVDPVDWAPAVDRAAAAGTPAAVLQLLDRHNRDCAALAARLGVAHLVVPGAVAGSPFEVVDVRRGRRWREVALWWPERSTLVVAEAVGTNAFYAPRGPAGVHLLLRPAPPRAQLGRFRPAHLLVGHGEGLHGADAASALERALATARTGLAGVLLALPRLALAARRGR